MATQAETVNWLGASYATCEILRFSENLEIVGKSNLLSTCIKWQEKNRPVAAGGPLAVANVYILGFSENLGKPLGQQTFPALAASGNKKHTRGRRRQTGDGK